MNLLVTGGTVFASRYTAEYFSALGHNVYVLNRATKPQSIGVIPIVADRHSLGDILHSYSFDAVIDVTAYNSDDVSQLIASLGDFGLYILVSSSAVYPETLIQPFSENDKTGTNSIWGKYGTDKIAAERKVMESTDNAYIIRPPYLCGPMNNLYREAFVFECAELERPFYLPNDGSMKLQFCHIGDMCRLIEAIIHDKPDEHILNVGYPEPTTVKDWVNLCYNIVGKTADFINVDDNIPQRNYFPFYRYEYILDVSSMLSVTGSITPLAESLWLSYEWFRKNRDKIIRKPLIDFIDNHLKGN